MDGLDDWNLESGCWRAVSGPTVVHTFSFSQSEVPVAFMFLSVVESSRPVCVRTITPMILATVAACSSDDTRRARWPRQTSCLAVNWNEKKRENAYYLDVSSRKRILAK